MKNIIPTCNQNFITKCILQNKRIDGRKKDEFRDLTINFGLDFGTCIVCLGLTKVLTSVTCEIIEPTINKSYEGVVMINLDLSPMASSNFERNKLNEECVEITRMLERSVIVSKCIDLESLCLIAGEKVWKIKVNLIVLDVDGNLPECTSVALTTALLHFKRPNVSVINDELVIHSFDEKHPLTLSLLCYPFCTKFAFYENNLVVCDPNEVEEMNSSGYLILGTNNFKEVTAIHITGKSQIIKNIVLKCCTLAWERTVFLTDIIKKSIENDKLNRTDSNIENNLVGFVPLVKSGKLFSYKKEITLIETEENETKETDQIEFFETSRTKIYRFANSEPDLINQEEETNKNNLNILDDNDDLIVLDETNEIET